MINCKVRVALFIFLIISSVVNAKFISGKVERVVDGDTLEVLTETERIRIRVRGIDAPETDQPYGSDAAQLLSDLTQGRDVLISFDERMPKDRYERVLASLAVGSTDVGLYMIENGAAWFYSAYGSQISFEWQEAYRIAETDARYLGRGLWHLAGPVPPWSWRKQRREAMQAADEEQAETLEGITKELESNVRLFEENWNDLFSAPENDEDKTNLPAKDRLSWWELFAKFGEGASRWIKAFFQSMF